MIDKTNSEILIASDHAGFDLKQHLIAHFPNLKWRDLGTYSTESVDYPDYATKLAEDLKKNPDGLGVLVCGSGQGMAIRANRFNHIRAALCWNEEIAGLARAHNDANVLCLPGRQIDAALANKILNRFLQTPFEGGRHQKRVDKLKC